MTTLADAERVRLRLFVAGTAPRSLRAVEVLRRVCEERQARQSLADLGFIPLNGWLGLGGLH